MMRAAVAMGVSPDGFWRLSLREWRWLTAVEAGPAPMGRAGLDEMMRRWPDEERG
jgi:uncharacterized phage protein (TIGR02216 family)